MRFFANVIPAKAGIRMTGFLATLGMTMMLGMTGLVFANSEYVVQMEGGQDPYLIVIQDTTGASSKDPGIYGRDALGTWQILMPGQIVGGKTTGGVLAHLDLTQVDGRYQTIVLVDGEVRIFHLNTSSNDPKSFISIGGAQTPVRDLFFPAQAIRLPPLSSSSDVSVSQGHIDNSRREQAVLISLRLPQATLRGGDGMTLLLVVKAARDSKSSALELVRDPLVIDYKFQSEAELRRLWIRNPRQRWSVLSRMALEHFSASTEENEPLAVREWRATLQVFVAEVLDRGRPLDKDKMFIPPYVDIQTGTLQAGALPKFSQPLTGRVRVTQLYDPVAGQQGVYIGPPREEITPQEFTFWGRIDNREDGQYWLFTKEDVHGDDAALVYINGQLYFVSGAPNDTPVRIFDQKVQKPEKLSFFVKTQMDTNQTTYVLFISGVWDLGQTRSETKVFSIRYDPRAQTLEVVKMINLTSKYYEPFELACRVHEMGKEFYFDTVTPLQESPAAYVQAYDPTVIHVNVTQSQPSGLMQGYLRPKEEISVIPNVLTYREFNEAGTSKRETGLFLEKKGEARGEVFPGNLLVPVGVASGISKEKPFLFSEAIEVPTLQDQGRLYAVAYDPSFRQGAEGFSILLVLVQNPSSSKPKFVPVAHPIACRFPIAKLKSVLLFSGKKKSADQYTLFIAQEDPPLREGVYPVSFQIQKGARDRDAKEDLGPLVFKVTFSDRPLDQKALLPSEIANRIMVDGKGGLYWVLDPRKPKSAADYTLIRLSDGNSVLVNSVDGRALAMKSLMDVKDGDPKDAARFSSASWRLFGKYGAEELAKIFEVADEKLAEVHSSGKPDSDRKNEESQRKKRKATVHQRMGDIFPGLVTLLDQAADPSQPAQHRVILVAEEDQPLLMGYIFKLWTEEKGSHPQRGLPENLRWTAENEAIKIYHPRRQLAGQDDVSANFAEMASLRPTERAVVVVDMDDLAHVGRPLNRFQQDQEPFLISRELRNAGEGDEGGRDAIAPHILYWLATEGKRLPIEQFANLSPEAPDERKVSVLLVGSPAKWKMLTQQAAEGAEVKAGLLRHFANEVSYVHGAWRVWGPNTALVGPGIQNLLERGVERYREEVFSELESLLREVSESGRPAEHVVLIVPPDIRDYVRNSIFAKWADSALAKNPWSHQNQKLRLFHIVQPEKGAVSSQAGVMEDLEIIKRVGHPQRPVLVADLSMIKAFQRPAGGNGAFLIEDLTIRSEEGVEAPDVGIEASHPHMLYLLATEGGRVPLRDFETFSRGPKNIPMLLIGTEAEWSRLLDDASIEKRGGLVGHFRRVTLSMPDHATRKKMLAQVLTQPAIRNLRYVFDSRVPGSLEPEPTEQAKAQDEMLAYIVSTCDRVARESGMDVLTAFLKAFQAFNRALVSDEETRTRKRIDRRAVQKILAQVFRMPLNPTLLPPEDPLVILQREDFPLLMQQAGSEGPFEQARRVAKLLLKQTDSTPKISMPSSVIFFGESSSGKTRFVYSLLNVLGLKLYDFNKPRDPEAQAFVLNCRKLVDDEGVFDREEDGEASGDGVMTVREAIRHLDNFITLPHGSRGFIIIDDAHAPRDHIRALLLSKIQSLIGAEDGMWRGRSEFEEGGLQQEIPLRNVTFILVANPTYDQKRIEQFQKDKWRDPTLEELLLASLTTDDQKLDPSFLKRFSGVVRMDTFASEARAPAVLGDVRRGALQIFSSRNQLILVSPEAADAICLRFPVDARTLLSHVPQALLARVENMTSLPVHIVVPRMTPSEPLSVPLGGARVQYDEREMDAYVGAHIQAFPIGQDSFEGRVELLKYLLGSVRGHVIETLIKSVQRDTRFAGGALMQQTTLAPLFHAIKVHLELNLGIRLEDLVLNPRDFGATNAASEADLRRVLTTRDTVRRGFLPKWIFTSTKSKGLSELVFGDAPFVAQDRSRRDVLVETSRKLEAQLRKFLEIYFQVGSMDTLPSPKGWLETMAPFNPQVSEQMGKQLGGAFLDFLSTLQEANLVEVIDAGHYSPITPYDAARFFLLALDRAIARLPWGALTQFMASSLAVATREISLGERPHVQAIFFEERDSFLAPRTPELPIQMVINTSVFKDWRGESAESTAKEDRMAKRLLDECERMLSKPDAS